MSIDRVVLETLEHSTSAQVSSTQIRVLTTNGIMV